ncbi:hypothetical protein cypCar_00040071 [Cyprinus carpio]|nr:hypothetical protein cypCar_00040071 [Cyprinus carpio]
MPAKPKSSTAARRAAESDEEQSAARRPPSAAAQHDVSPGESAEELDNRSLEEILASIPPPPPPAMSSEPGAPRLMITHILNRNFKSYAGEQILGPFHKSSTKIRSQYAVGSDPDQFLTPHRTVRRDDTSDSQRVVFFVRELLQDNFLPPYSHSMARQPRFIVDVGTLRAPRASSLDHNASLILQGEVEQIAMMKPKDRRDDEGMLEYRGHHRSCRLKRAHQYPVPAVELLNEQRGEKLNRVKLVEKEKSALEGEKNKAVEFLSLENDVFKKRNLLCQFYVHDLQKRVSAREAEKQQVQEDTKDLSDKSSQLTEEMKSKNEELKGVEKKLTKLTKFIESQKEKFTQLDLQDVEVREKLKHTKSKAKKQQKQLQKDKEKLDEVRSVPASSEKIIAEASAQKEELEKKQLLEEQKLAQVMESLKEETSGLQEDKEKREQELLELSKTVNQTRSRMDVAQSELDIYLSQHNTAVSQLNQAKDALQETVDTLRERRAAIKDLNARIPPRMTWELVDEKYEHPPLSSRAAALWIILVDTIDTGRGRHVLKDRTFGVRSIHPVGQDEVLAESMGSCSTPRGTLVCLTMVACEGRERDGTASTLRSQGTWGPETLEGDTRRERSEGQALEGGPRCQGQVIEQAGAALTSLQP